MTKVKLWLVAIPLGSLAALPATAQQSPIKIGEVNSYSGMAAFTAPYKNGLLLGV
jgi:branched-chain amino acid transport system substrate-binding protein